MIAELQDQDVQQRNRLENLADSLAAVANNLGLEDLADTIRHDTHRRLRAHQARVMVLGEIKQGKSTLINALLGRDVLPMGVTPTTGATIVVRSGSTEGIFHIGENGIRSVLRRDEFVRRAKGVETGSDEGAGQLEVVVAPDILPVGLELVDTPGINDIASYRAAVSRGELPRADVLVLVLDATQLLNRTELAFVRDALVSVGGLSGSGARLWLVINRIDLVHEDDRPKLQAYLTRELGTLLSPDTSHVEIFETSAREALRDPEASGHGVVEVQRLRARLHDLAGSREQILPSRVRASLLRYTTLIEHNLAIFAHALSLEQEALRREIIALERQWADRDADMDEVRAQMAQSRDKLLETSDARVRRFREQLFASATATVAGGSQRVLTNHLPAALHDAFVAFAQQESERLHAALEELTRRAIHTHSAQVRRRLYDATLRFGFRGPTIYLDPPSLALEAGLVVVGLTGTAVMYFGNMVAGMVMTIAGPLATMMLREKSLRDARASARAELPAALDRAASSLRDGIRRVVDDHIAALDEHLLLASKAIGEQLIAVLRTAQQRSEATATASVTEAQDAGDNPRKPQNQLATMDQELRRIRQELEALPTADR